MVAELAAKRVGQSRHATNHHSQREIEALNVACTNALGIGIASILYPEVSRPVSGGVNAGSKGYITAVDEMLSDRVDFAQLVKIYAAPQEPERRYSPPEFVCATPNPISEKPQVAAWG